MPPAQRRGQRIAVAFYGIAFDLTALTFNAVWRTRFVTGCSAKPSTIRPPRLSAGAFSSALIWLASGALLGAALPVLGSVVIAAFNAYYWRPIRGETPGA